MTKYLTFFSKFGDFVKFYWSSQNIWTLIYLILGKTGAIKTEITKDPRPQVKDVMMSKLRNGANKDDSDTDNDDW